MKKYYIKKNTKNIFFLKTKNSKIYFLKLIYIFTQKSKNEKPYI